MKKILIIEDEFYLLRPLFDYINIVYCQSQFEFEVFVKSQDFRNYEAINEYEKIFIDVSLHKDSEKDGYVFASEIYKLVTDKSKIYFLTAKDDLEKRLKDSGLTGIKMISKPIYFEVLKEILSE